LLPSNKKIYFASDLHLTCIYDDFSRKREQDFVRWLDTIKSDAAHVFLLGDIFDFWFEYRYVIPCGYTRLLGKLAELTDNGISVHFFVGNHDQWMRNYLSHELNVNVYHKPTEFEINEKLFLIGHGHQFSHEGLKDRIQKFVFANAFFRFMFAAIHPRWGITFGRKKSIKNREKRGFVAPFEDLENEFIYKQIQKIMEIRQYDFFVFGHRHLALDLKLNEKTKYINTGEWIEKQTFAVYDGKELMISSNSK